MRRRRSPELVAEELAAIPDLPRAELIEHWTAFYGRPPPKGLSRRLLEYAAAYHVQKQAYGGPSPTLRRKLRRLAESHYRDKSASTPRTVVSRTLPPGTRLVREWYGKP